MKNYKRLKKIPNSWKIAAITPIYKTGVKIQERNYKPVSLLDTDSKVFEKCVYKAFHSLLLNT